MKLQWVLSMAVGVLMCACAEPKSKPELALKDLQGKAVSLAQLQGKPMVVNAWATWCAPCRREMPLLQQAQQQYPNVQFVLINQGEKVSVIEEFLQQNQLQFPHLWQDPSYQTREVLQYQGMPSTYFLNDKGEVVAQSVGELEAEHLEQYLKQIM